MIKEFILGFMALYEICRHDSEGDSAQQNSIVHIDDSHTEFSDSNTELTELRDTLEKAEAKLDQFCTSLESDCNKYPEMLDTVRKATREYTEAAYQKFYQQSQKNLTPTLFEKNSEIRKTTDVDGDKEYKMGRIDSILRQDECRLMYHAIENMNKWMHLRKWSSKSK